MAQSFENVATTDYIDTGLLRLLARDLTSLTAMSGTSDPSSPPTDALCDNTTQGVLKLNGDVLVDYKNGVMNSTALSNALQPLNSILTTVSEATLSVPCIVTTAGGVIPLTQYGYSAAVNTTIDGVKGLAKKDTVGANQIADNSITQAKLQNSLPTENPFKCGDVLYSCKNMNRNGFLKLGAAYTLGSGSSNATYRNNTYYNLYAKLWEKSGAVIRDYSGNITNKGSSASEDFNNNKTIDLPSFDEASSYETVEFNYTGGPQSYKVPKNVFYVRVECVGAAGGAGAATRRSEPYDLIYGSTSRGERAVAILAVTPGEKLFVFVGGAGGNSCEGVAPGTPAYGIIPGGYNGGGSGVSSVSYYYYVLSTGGGGGMTDIRTSTNIDDQIFVAAGGGGSFYDYDSSYTNLVNVLGGSGVNSINDPLGTGEVLYQYQGHPGSPGNGAGAGSYVADSGGRGRGGDGAVGYYGPGGGGGYIGGGAGMLNTSVPGTVPFERLGSGGGLGWADPTRVVNNSYVSTSAYSEATGNGWAKITPIILPVTRYIKY